MFKDETWSRFDQKPISKQTKVKLNLFLIATNIQIVRILERILSCIFYILYTSFIIILLLLLLLLSLSLSLLLLLSLLLFHVYIDLDDLMHVLILNEHLVLLDVNVGK